jgi:zinc transport system substrate-binding protein
MQNGGKMNLRRLILPFLAILIVIAAGAWIYWNQQGSSNNKLQVSASFYPVYYFASEIGGEKVQVKNIVPSGTEPHDYEPTPQDIVELQKSDLVVINGAGFEPWIENLKEDLGSQTIVTSSTGIELLTGQEEEHEGEEEGEAEGELKDPHVWLSPKQAAKQIENILAGFISVDPGNKTFYEENATRLKTKLAELDNNFSQGLSNCSQRNFVTSHVAFAYLAKDYGLTQVAISGISPEEEPSAARLAEIADFARKNNVKHIFFETLVSPALSETVAREVGAETLVLDPIEGISEDEINQGENYFTKMETNLANLKIALECR